MEIYVPECTNTELKVLIESLRADVRDNARTTAECIGEMRAMRDVSSRQEDRLRALENDQRATNELARDARNASLQLAGRVDDNERTMAQVHAALRDDIEDVKHDVAEVRKVNEEQTPILREIRDEAIARKAIESKRSEERAASDRKQRAWLKWAAVVAPVLIALFSYLGTRAASHRAPTSAIAPTSAHVN